ncbi:MAG TPA: hypothetical protein PLO63_10790 [Syntrophales bacterium]|nr:hypothetical protein [Syntrophales bacterium]
MKRSLETTRTSSRRTPLRRRLLNSPSIFFSLLSGVLFLVFLCAAALASLSRLLMDATGIDLLAAIGNSSNIGEKKLLLLTILMGCCLAVTAAIFLFFARKPGLAGRTAVLTLLVPAYLAVYAFLQYPVHHAALLEQIEVTAVPAMADSGFFNKSNLAVDGIRDEDELHRACMKRFNQVRETLRVQWGIEDPRKLEALFLMNSVSALWGFGNSVHYTREGCVEQNEKTGFRIDVPEGIRDYLESEIGCCSDSAHVLKVLLDRSGIPNRRVVIAHGHMMNEAAFSDGWMTLDATTNMAFFGDWTSIQRRRGHGRNSVHVLVFPHSNHASGSNPLYRPAIGHLRFALLLDAVNKSAPPVAFPDGTDGTLPAGKGFHTSGETGAGLPPKIRPASSGGTPGHEKGNRADVNPLPES